MGNVASRGAVAMKGLEVGARSVAPSKRQKAPRSLARAVARNGAIAGGVLSFARAGVPLHAPLAVVECHDQRAEESELDLGRVRVGEGSGAGAGLDPR